MHRPIELSETWQPHLHSVLAPRHSTIDNSDSLIGCHQRLKGIFKFGTDGSKVPMFFCVRFAAASRD
jgi:hypothetical protein